MKNALQVSATKTTNPRWQEVPVLKILGSTLGKCVSKKIPLLFIEVFCNPVYGSVAMPL